MTTLPSTLNPRDHDWLSSDALGRIFDAVKEAGGEARVVGGAVRNALLKREVLDVDLAVTLPPDQVSMALTKNGIKVVPTGIDHGTLTAVVNRQAFEITTLRRDIETDGRHARVVYTDDWQTDAARRDFTMNALYVESNGTLHDYFGGRDDLACGRVRFIGDARARIREDVLRILRFFRFAAWFNETAIDAEGLAACSDLAGLIPQLSVERMWREIVKLLSAPKPATAWASMIESGVVEICAPEATNIERMKALLPLEIRHQSNAAALTRLAALLPHMTAAADRLARHFKVSNKEYDKLFLLLKLPGELTDPNDKLALRRLLYHFGAENVQESLLLAAADHAELYIQAAYDFAASWEHPIFPFQGAEILKLGILPGPSVGTTLRAVEEWWIQHEFKPTRDECLAKARDQLKI